MSQVSMSQSKTLHPRQAWFLGVVAAAVALMFAFVILPKIDPKAPTLVGGFAPEFNLELLHGGAPGDRVRLIDLRGQVVVLDFWASWCKPCAEQAAIMEQLSQEFASQDVYVLGVATSDSMDEAKGFIDSHATTYPMAFDEGNAMAQAYGVTVLPTVVVVDAMGQVADLHARIVGKRELAELIRSKLQTP
jgi:cytochrome c biogenesis protein CcmG, thiol:disulfide interchange protein DsbE